MKYCYLIGPAAIVAAHTSLVYGCDPFIASDCQKASGIKRLAMPD